MLTLYTISAAARSIHRPADGMLPKISVRSDNDSDHYTLQSSHLAFYPFFSVFDKSFFDENLLPKTPIAHRNNPTKTIDPEILNNLIEGLLKEIHQKKMQYADFQIITSKNFNRKKECGMMILKFKDHPFIVKLAIESPQTFINPYCKGLDNVWFFPLGGGINRHLAGLTRIKNRQMIQNRLADHPEWSTLVDVPRKWYWIPKKDNWLEITGSNMGGQKTVTTKIPSTYCIIADEIHTKQEFSLFNKDQTTLALKICNYLDLWIDPHINNFMVEQETNKIVIVDTEHFPSVVGIKEKVTFDNYTSWYLYLMGKCTKDWFFRTKDERHFAQSAAYTWDEYTKLT
ncbi:MAG: hypothetical protein P4L31_04405 [Candidatus Babeliales bacterium]|nr:hypothetical protein [Candidatus Babeliales bacterium]